MTDLVAMLNTLLDKDGTILVEGLMDTVAPVTEEELKTYEAIDFDIEDYRNDIKAPKLVHNAEKVKTLMARWRYPSLSLHGIQGAFSEAGSKTVIPKKVIGNLTSLVFCALERKCFFFLIFRKVFRANCSKPNT
jgi:nonspecific dipeptidase